MKHAIALALAVGCTGGEGEWVVSTWGEDFIEQGLPPAVFEDGCSVRYSEFVVGVRALQLLDGDDEVVADLPSAVLDLVTPGPAPLARQAVPADVYSTVKLVVGPGASLGDGTGTDAQVAELEDAGASVIADGVLTCGATSAHFRWAFQAETTYDCAPPELTIPVGGTDDTQLTIHGDHLFYNGLVNADAAVRGTELLAADADADGELTEAELRAVSIPELGFDVGPYTDTLDLFAFVEHLSRTIGHIDGEGECLVDF